VAAVETVTSLSAAGTPMAIIFKLKPPAASRLFLRPSRNPREVATPRPTHHHEACHLRVARKVLGRDPCRVLAAGFELAPAVVRQREGEGVA
jgi:hypothetical protein